MTNLQSKLSVMVLGSLLVTSILTSALVLHSESEILNHQIAQDGQSLARTIAAMSVEELIGNPDIPHLETEIEMAVQSNPRLQNVKVYNQEGRLFFQYPPDAAPVSSRGDLRLFKSPILYEVQGLPQEFLGHVEVSFDNRWFSSLIQNSMVRVVAGTTLSFAFLASVLWFFLKRNVLQPVAALDRQVAKIAQGDLAHPIVLEQQDELGRLAGALEAMRSNLKASYARIERQVSELKELDGMKNEFLANTSHELKTPLNGIVGLTESLLLGAYGKLENDQEQAMKMLSSCADRLCRMVESILKFSRLHREGLAEESKPEEQDLLAHLEEALIDLYATAERSGLPLVLSIPAGLRVTYPRSELEGVIRILVDNALKFTMSGCVEIVARKWQGKGSPGFQIAVRDSGIGIAPELHRSIFEPFVQGFRHETRAHGGVGLGLAIASKLVRRMGAEIVLESDLGKGACFTILVPEDKPQVPLRSLYESWLPLRLPTGEAKAEIPVVCRETEAPPPAPLASAASGSSPDHVLVVDDDAVNREVIRQVLRGQYRVSQAADGPTCLELLRSTPVDAVLLDIMMPGMSGYDVLETMRHEGLLDTIPVIVVSAKTSRDAVLKGLELGAADVLGKPFHREELLQRLRNRLQQKRARDQSRAAAATSARDLESERAASSLKNRLLLQKGRELRIPLEGILEAQRRLEACLDSRPEERAGLASLRRSAESVSRVVEEILELLTDSDGDSGALELVAVRASPSQD